MPALRNDVDPDGLLEYSVVFTDRSLNHMSASFQEVMRDISTILKQVYKAESVAVIPGGGTQLQGKLLSLVVSFTGKGIDGFILTNG